MSKSEKPSIPIEERLLRLSEVLELIPVSRSAWYEGIAAGRYPQGVKLSARTVAWRGRQIAELRENGVMGAQ